MTWKEAENVPNHAPCKLADGKFGLVIRWAADDQTLGIQVPGEEDIRWIPVSRLRSSGDNALIEVTHA